MSAPFTLATERGSMAAFPAMNRTSLSSEGWKARIRATGVTMTVGATYGVVERCIGSKGEGEERRREMTLFGRGSEDKIYSN